MSKRDEQMGANAVVLAILAIFALIGHIYAAVKVPKIYWRLSKWFWYFFGACVVLTLFNHLLYKIGWLYPIQSLLDNGPWLILPGFIWFCAIPYFVFRAKQRADWETWPSFGDYSQIKSNGGGLAVKLDCYSCGNKSIRNIGFAGKSDVRRLHVCDQCSTTLYRSQQ